MFIDPIIKSTTGWKIFRPKISLTLQEIRLVSGLIAFEVEDIYGASFFTARRAFYDGLRAISLFECIFVLYLMF